MVEAIALVLWVGTTIFFVWRDITQKDERVSHEWWLSDLRECLHSIEREFSRCCLSITSEALLQKDFSYAPQTKIRELKKKYSDEVKEMVIKRKGQYFLKTIPDYVEREYERNLSEIADIYCDILNSQWQ
jgi:hypothetical protein